jgi:hypothetical protein
VSYPHLKPKEKDNDLPTIALDYMFVHGRKKKDEREEEELERGMPTVEIEDSRTKMLLARPMGRSRHSSSSSERPSETFQSCGPR